MRRLLSSLLALLLLAGCGRRTATVPAERLPSPSPAPTPDPVAQQAAAMSDGELVGQLLVVGIPGPEVDTQTVKLLQACRPGGVILFRQNVENASQLTLLTAGLKALNAGHIPLLLCVDQEGGQVSRMPREVAGLPAPCDYIRAGGDPYDLGAVLAAQCAAFGFQLNFAPVLDVWSNPDNQVIGSRALGTDAQSAAQAGVQVMQGLMDGGVIPVGKHFPGHGDTAADSHTALPVVDKTQEELEELELVPFRAAMDRGLPAVMVGHLLLTRLDPELPASLSPAVVGGLLRQELGFDGVVFTDDLTMGAITQSWDTGEAALLAVEAGCDMVLVCHGTDRARQVYDTLLSALTEGRLTRERLEESVCRILSLKAAFGVEDTPAEAPDLEELNARIKAVCP